LLIIGMGRQVLGYLFDEGKIALMDKNRLWKGYRALEKSSPGLRA
jgi:hypothetical protein